MRIEPAGLYLHVPFCKKRCRYCDFISGTDHALIPAWMNAVITEAGSFTSQFPDFNSFFMGGGTPSLLEIPIIQKLLTALTQTFSLKPDSEITLEVNPDDVTERKLEAWLKMGFNRISIGVQSLVDQELDYLGRRHNAACALTAMKQARDSGFPLLGVDLMFGHETQSRDSLYYTLKQIIDVSPDHISCYQLTINRPVKQISATEAPLKTWDDAELAQRFMMISNLLVKSGYDHYEVSNFSKAGKPRCRHNMKYWTHVPYLGLGPGAHSFSGKKRWWNTADTAQYCKRVQNLQSPVQGSEILTQYQLDMEKLVLGLRTSDGLDLDFLSRFRDADTVITRAIEEGFFNRQDTRIIPTARGLLFADGLAQRFIT